MPLQGLAQIHTPSMIRSHLQTNEIGRIFSIPTVRTTHFVNRTQLKRSCVPSLWSVRTNPTADKISTTTSKTNPVAISTQVNSSIFHHNGQNKSDCKTSWKTFAQVRGRLQGRLVRLLNAPSLPLTICNQLLVDVHTHTLTMRRKAEV